MLLATPQAKGREGRDTLLWRVEQHLRGNWQELLATLAREHANTPTRQQLSRTDEEEEEGRLNYACNLV